MNKQFVKIIFLFVCLIESHQANKFKTSFENNTLLRLKELIGNKSITYYVAGGNRKPEVSELSKYLVSIRTRNPLKYFGDNHFCGGVIISKKAVLTSGYCVMDKRRVLTRARRILLVGGTPNRIEPAETTAQFPVQSVVANSNFVRNNRHDIAVIHLKNEIPEDNEGVKIAQMPSGPPAYNASCIVLGWGRMLLKGPLSALAFHVNVRIQEPRECKKFLKEYFYDGVLCAVGEPSDNSPCLGDSGGPLICNNELTGIVSFVTGCIWKNSPSLFTDVWHHRKWIEKHLTGSSLCHNTPNLLLVLVFVMILK